MNGLTQFERFDDLLPAAFGVYREWGISVWCFLAAILSFLLLLHFVQPVWRSMRTA